MLTCWGHSLINILHLILKNYFFFNSSISFFRSFSSLYMSGKRQRVDVLAAAAGTIPYELTCAVSRRVPRVYYKDGREVEKELLLRF